MQLALKRITDSRSADYAYMTKLLAESFPQEEYRDFGKLRLYTETEKTFHNNLIVEECPEGGCWPVGLLTYWIFDAFVYIEHFAIDPSLRNEGLGASALALMPEITALPVVLEVEEPENPLAIRRIGFYRRNGFDLADYDYMQPPYREGDGWLPMRLMIKARPESSLDIDHVKSVIYRNVYGVDYLPKNLL